jgi:hypothetical protein
VSSFQAEGTAGAKALRKEKWGLRNSSSGAAMPSEGDRARHYGGGVVQEEPGLAECSREFGFCFKFWENTKVLVQGPP